MNRRNLTVPFIEALKCPDGSDREITWDTLLTGLGVRVSSKGRKTWLLVYRDHGKQVWFKLGLYPALSLADAREAAREKLRAVQTGTVEAAPAGTTFADLCDSYLNHLASGKGRRHHVRPRTVHEYTRQIEHVLKPEWANKQVADIGRSDVIELVTRISDHAPIMANRTLNLISAIYNFAIDFGVGGIKINPASRLARMLRTPENSRERSLTDDEIRAVWPHFNAPLRLLLLTGQRREEVNGMRWAEIDGDAWTIPEARAKNHRATIVPLVGVAAEILRSISRGGEWVFPVDLRAAYERAKEKSGINPFTPHDLRRTMETGLAALGVKEIVQHKILNHAPVGVTARVCDRYQYLAEKREALEAWDQHIAQIVGANVIVMARSSA